MIQVLIVEDLPILLAGLRMRLAAEPDLSVIGGASDFATGLDMTMRYSPDVVVLDIDPPFVESVTTASQIREICQHARVVLLGMNDDGEARLRAREAGAAAFVAKSLPVATLVSTIRQVAN
jgi:two-component system, NarL family, nitrate/nitrite response regulator NarL